MGNYYQIQYVGYVKPVMAPAADPPALTHIGWHVQQSEPVRELPRPVDVGHYSRSPEILFLPTFVAGFSARSDVVRLSRVPVTDGLYVKPIEPSLLTDPTLRTYFQNAEPVRRRPAAAQEGSSQAIFLAAWYVAIDPAELARNRHDVIRRPAVPVQTGIDVHPLAPAVVEPPMQWFARTSEPVREVQYPVNVGGHAGPLETHLTEAPVPAWLQPQREPIRTPPRAIDAPTWLPKPFAVTPDSWHALPAVSALAGARRPEGGAVAPPIYVTLPVIGWHALQSEPLARSRPLTPGSSVNLGSPIPGDPGNIVPIHWYRQAVGPVMTAAPTVNRQGGAYVPEPEGLGVEFPDKWQVRAEIPVRRRPFRGEGGAPVAFIVVTQEWMPPIQQPVLRAQHTHRGGGAFVEFAEAAETWLQPTPELVRRTPRVLSDDSPRFEPSLFVAPPEIAWYTPLSEPVRRVPTAATRGGYQQLMFFRPVAADRGLVEAGQIWAPHIEAGQVFTPHIDEGQIFTPHVEAAQVV